MSHLNRPSWNTHLRYRFDRTLSRGLLALSFWLAMGSLLVILLLAGFIHFSGLYPGMSLPAIFWTMLLQALAPNTVDVNAGPWPFLLAMLVITLLGLLVVSIFIGIITNSIDDKIDALRKGRSLVLEKNHILILGWGEQVFTILSEIILANQKNNRSCVVILADKDKVEMEDAVRTRLPHTGRTEIVCRSGDALDMLDLNIVSVNTSKSIIILPPEGNEPDTYVIKALLAILHNPHRRSAPYHIVTEIHETSNLDAACLVSQDETILLQINDIIAHIIAQTCLQTGLSMIYTGLLKYEGEEIYITDDPALTGLPFGQILSLYEDSSVIGYWPKDGKPKLNPPMDTLINPGDRLVVISENETTIHLSSIKTPPIETASIRHIQPTHSSPVSILILGWNERGTTVLYELDKLVTSGSRFQIVANDPGLDKTLAVVGSGLKRGSLTFLPGNFNDRRLLDGLHLEQVDHVIVLADIDDVTLQMADGRTLITLLHLRDIKERQGLSFSIVSEMLDVRNHNLAEVTRVDDFIISDELASYLMTQISENRDINLVFEDLFYPQGSEIFLKPINDYVLTGQPLHFYTLVEAARQRGEAAIGYRITANSGDLEKDFGIVVNPNKSDLVTFQMEDRLIVLAEIR